MSTITIKLKNCKKIEDKEITFDTDQSVYLIKASNDCGKSTLKDVLVAMQTASVPFTEPITYGKDEMSIDAIGILGADKRPYVAQLLQKKGKPAKWILIDEEGKKITKLEEYRRVFQYTDFNAEDFMRKSLNAKGQKEQKELFFSLLDDDSKNKYEIAELEEKVSYDNRTLANADVDRLDKIVKSYVITAEDKVLLTQAEEAKKLLAELEAERLALSDKQAQKTIAEGKKRSLTDSIEMSKANIATNITRIASLQREIDSLTKVNTEAAVSIAAMQKDHDAIVIPKVPLTQEIDARIVKGKDIVEKIKTIEDAAKKHADNKAEHTTAYNKWKELDNSVTKHRKEKESIIKNSKFPVKELTWDSEKGLMYGELSFNEKQISTSLAWKIGARIAMAINKAPMLILGSANDLDKESRKEILSLAKENGYQFILDEVQMEKSELSIEPMIAEE